MQLTQGAVQGAQNQTDDVSPLYSEAGAQRRDSMCAGGQLKS